MDRFPVSNLARDLLLGIADDPLYDIMAINSNLYNRLKVLREAKMYRKQLFHLKKYLGVCRIAQDLYRDVNTPVHVGNELDLYSLNELVALQRGFYNERLRKLVADSIAHIIQCELCKAKGYICEVCDDSRDILFPFESERVRQCDVCLSVFHKTCHASVKGVCPKCERIKQRKLYPAR